MSRPGRAVGGPAEAEARTLLESLDEVELRRYVIAGHCLRFDPTSRQLLKEFRQRVTAALRSRSPQPKNFLVWGAPGSGKSYLIQEIASSSGTDVEFRSVNLARLDREGLVGALEGLGEAPGPVLCLIDEVDAHPQESWPYEVLLPFLEPSVPPSAPLCFCLAGSGGHDPDEFKSGIRGRPKGPDLLSRVPVDHELEVTSLDTGDRVLVAVVQMCDAAAAEGRSVREIEKLALYYLAVHDRYGSARQLRSLASECAQRLPAGETQIRYDYLFPAGDPANKEFWASSRPVHATLANRFVGVDPTGMAEARGARIEEAPGVSSRAPPEDRHRTRRLAVLPFANMSPDPQDEFFADGLTEEMITELSRVPGFQVIARTSVMPFKGTSRGIKEVARELNVDVALEGSVRKSGNRIRITAQLIDTRSEAHLWTDRFDRELTEIFELQSEIATRVAGALKVELVPASQRPPDRPATRSLAAYEYYLKGRRSGGCRESRTIGRPCCTSRRRSNWTPSSPSPTAGWPMAMPCWGTTATSLSRWRSIAPRPPRERR